MLTLLLAPLSGVMAGLCYCDDVAADSVEIAPFSCCGETYRCCYEHGEGQTATPLIVDLNLQTRADFKVAVRQAVPPLPAPVPVVALEQKMIHCADPPDTQVRELSLRQSWLI